MLHLILSAHGMEMTRVGVLMSIMIQSMNTKRLRKPKSSTISTIWMTTTMREGFKDSMVQAWVGAITTRSGDSILGMDTIHSGAQDLSDLFLKALHSGWVGHKDLAGMQVWDGIMDGVGTMAGTTDGDGMPVGAILT